MKTVKFLIWTLIEIASGSIAFWILYFIIRHAINQAMSL